MKTYIYKLKDEAGRTMHGFMEARNKKELKQKLMRHSQYFFVAAYPYPRQRIFQKRVSLEILLMFTHRLSALIESGIPILSAMNILWRQTEDKTLQLVISHLRRHLEEGNRISEALNDFPNIFPVIYRALISVAERAGGLVLILKKLTYHLDYQKKIIARAKRATMYPAIVISLSLIVILGLFTFVVPTFQKVLEQLSVELPGLTKAILLISATLRSPVFIVGVMIVGVGVIFAYKVMRKNRRFSYYMDTYKLKIPFFGRLIYLFSLSQFIRSLGLLLGAGLPIIESFEVSKGTVENSKISGSLNASQRKVEQGVSLYESFNDVRDYPVMMTEMVGVGESSGTIVKVFDNLALHFDEEVDYNINKFLTAIEPSLIIFVGVIVLLTLLAIYLPIFTLWESLSIR